MKFTEQEQNVIDGIGKNGCSELTWDMSFREQLGRMNQMAYWLGKQFGKHIVINIPHLANVCDVLANQFASRGKGIHPCDVAHFILIVANKKIEIRKHLENSKEAIWKLDNLWIGWRDNILVIEEAS